MSQNIMNMVVTRLIISVKKCVSAIHENLFAYANQDCIIFYTQENSKMFNITSKYFRFFDNTSPANGFTHITRDFLTCYSRLYHGSMGK